MPLLALCMITLDEGRSLARTLASVRGIADVVVIVDTGSTDDTRAIAQAAGVQLHVAPFVDFATTRNLALDLAGAHADLVLMLSGGETLHDAAALRGFLEQRRAAQDGAYYVQIRMGACAWDVARLSRPAARWRYVGAVHEVLVGPAGEVPTASAPGFILHEKDAHDLERDRARWRRDVGLLMPGAERGEPRALFYLGQTYQCLGEHAAAVRWYERRIAAGGWGEETWEAAYRRAQLLPGQAQRIALLDCYEAAPHRAEPLHTLARACFEAGEFAKALLYAAAGARIPRPGNVRLFLDPEVYAWRCWDVLAMAAWHVGELALGLDAAHRAFVGYVQAGGGAEADRLRAHVEWYAARGAGEPGTQRP